MNKFFSMVGVGLLLAAVGLVGYWLGGGFDKNSMPDHSREAKKPSYWVAPMDPNYRRDQPGKSPMGMDLVPVYPSSEGGVRISPAVEHNLGVRTGQVTLGPMNQPIDAVGYVELDEEKLSHIHTRVDGWVESLAVSSVGDVVTQGEVVFELYSPILVSAQEEYLLALRSKNKEMINATKQRLASLGLGQAVISSLSSTRKVSQRIAFLAPSDGILTSLNVREGMFVTPSLDVMASRQLESIWGIPGELLG